MKQVLTTIAACFISIISFAQYTVKGRVTSSNTELVESATITLRDAQNTFSTVAGSNGYYEFTRLKHGGSYTLTAEHVSMNKKLMSVLVNDKVTTVDILLNPASYFLEPLEVKSLRASDKAPFAKSNISKAEIVKNNLGQDLPFLLNQTPSVVINSDAGNGVGYTGIRIRGSDATRINVTMNGIPYNDAESQGSFFVDLPDIASSLNSIQIQRGVGTSSNGAGAFGGTINLSTNEFIDSAYAEFNNSYGSFNTWKNTIKAGTGLLNNHFTVDARLSRVTSNGFIDRAESKLSSIYLSGAYINQNSSLRFNVIHGNEKTYQAWNGIPESMLETNRTYNSAGTEKPGEPYDNETDNYQQDHYQTFFNHSFNSQLSFNTALFLTQGKGYYEQYKAGRKFSDFGLPNPVIGNTTVTKTDLVRQLWLDNNYYGQILSLQYKKQNNQLSIGGGWNRYDGNHYGKIIWAQVGIPKDYRWYDLDARKTDENIYAKWQHNLSTNWQTFADVQYRKVNYRIGGFRDNPTVNVERNFDFVNPKAGITYSRNGWQAYLSYALANKEPNRDDFEAGVLNQPKHETLHDFEMGVERKTTSYNWSVNAYYMRYHNQLVLTGQVNDVGAYTRVNIPKSYRAGIELQGNVLIARWLNVAANVAFSENKIKKSTEYVDDYDNGGQKFIEHKNTDISFSPAVVGGATFNFIPAKDVEFSLLNKYVSRQYLDNTEDNLRSLDAYFIQDVRLTYALHNRLFKQTNLIAQVNNVFNKKYEPNGYTFSYIYGQKLTTENYYFPMAGTNFMVGVNVSL